ncbi:hypothetical protein IFR04_001577 [Cadophora malorum]|uniref:Uncharacterized protein n=1 Tax=Cadophora malorum TaxID=108018 RepID=A0A8H8BV34_9HELO|nr:hypothetical protein IFR04_001577 [Cadophora malorum]
MYLQDIYEKGEEWEIEAWRLAREWSEDAVRDMVRRAGLAVGGKDEFVVMDEEELGLQIRWRREGDWRAGSTPLGRPTRNSDLPVQATEASQIASSSR